MTVRVKRWRLVGGARLAIHNDRKLEVVHIMSSLDHTTTIPPLHHKLFLRSVMVGAFEDMRSGQKLERHDANIAITQR